jgi:hypothetical protein
MDVYKALLLQTLRIMLMDSDTILKKYEYYHYLVLFNLLSC